MLRKKKLFLLLMGILLFIVLFSKIPSSSKVSYDDNKNSNKIEYPSISANLKGLDDITITKIERDVELNEYGLVHIEDEIEVENNNHNSIDSFFIGIPEEYSEDLVYYEAIGEDKSTLLTEASDNVMDDFELIAVYFDSPLLPDQSKTIEFKQTYKNLLTYEIPEDQKDEDDPEQLVSFEYYVFPLLPYEIDGKIIAKFDIPTTSDFADYSDWGDVKGDTITYDHSDIVDPFLENLAFNKLINISFTEEYVTKMEFIEINREIFISPWGILKVTDEFLVKNKGEINIDELSFEIPGPAKEVYVYDDLGEITGITLDPEINYTKVEKKDLKIDLSENRVQITPGSKYRFSVRYFLPFEKYFSINWFQESFYIDVIGTANEFLGREQTIKIIIEGCYSIDYVSDPPDAIENTQNSIILVYESDYLSPLERKEILLTFTVNYFDLLFRPFIFMLLVGLISTAYVLIIKSKKEVAEDILLKELIPVNELRQFCSLYEEKNALILEIREAEELTKRKKMVKKKYKNLLNKNTVKIQEIENELIPFKKAVVEASLTFENILSKLEVLEAERISVNDSLNLLEARYKRGRLPSKAAYLKLTDNFLRRRRKIDRSIDKSIQTLKAYLL